MQVSFNPAIQNNNTFSASKSNDVSKSLYRSKPTHDEILSARTKKAISECRMVALGVFILYFAMKRTHKVEQIKDVLKQEVERQKQNIPRRLNINLLG